MLAEELEDGAISHRNRLLSRSRRWAPRTSAIWSTRSRQDRVELISGRSELEALIAKIVSGGQTGADRAALDFALAHGIRAGGWVPKGRLAEDGRIPEHYPDLVETESAEPAVRTARNVRDADATLILSHGPLDGGSRLTFAEAARAHKPVLHLDLDQMDVAAAAARLRGWLAECRPATLNVAGPRASKDPQIGAATRAVLEMAWSVPVS